MQNAADHAAVVHTLLATNILWQMPFNLPPLFIIQPEKVPPHLLSYESHIERESTTDSASNIFIGF